MFGIGLNSQTKETDVSPIKKSCTFSKSQNSFDKGVYCNLICS